MVKSKALALSIGATAISTWATLKRTIYRAWAGTGGKMDAITTVDGKITRCMATECFNGPTANDSKVNTSWTRRKARAPSTGKCRAHILKSFAGR